MKFVIYAPTYDHKSAGIKALHRLAWELQSRGYLTWIANARHGDPARPVPLISSEFSDYWDSICIYPEIVKWNPLGMDRRVHWLLKPDTTDYGSDLVISWSSSWQLPDMERLYVPLIDETYFHPQTTKQKRESILTYHANRVPGDIEITDLWPERQEVLGDLLRIGKVLRCGDPLTLLAAEARFCGCPVELLNGQTDDSIPLDAPDFIKRYKAYEKGAATTIDNFIKLCADYWPETHVEPMKILVFVPTYRRADTGEINFSGKAEESVKALEFGPHNVTVEISVDETEDKKGNVIRQYNKAEQMTLHGGYDALLTIEDDMIVPKDAIIKLAATPGDVIYGVYLFRHNSRTLNTMRAVSSVNFDSSLMHYPHLLAQAVRLKAFPVSGLGMGCTLIKRKVLELAPFHVPEEGGFPDGPLAQDCQRLHLRQMARFDVVCGHIDRELNRVWFPNLSGSRHHIDAVKCKILASFNGTISGESFHYQAGGEYQIPMSEAVEWERAGYLEVTEGVPEHVRDL